jgi:hypothetical protein
VGEGTEIELTIFLEDLKRGPTSSQVDQVIEAEFGHAKSFSEFTI